MNAGDANDDQDKSSFSIPTTLAGAVALVVAALAAVGVGGAVLVRAVRNQPFQMAAIFVLAIFLAAIPAVVGLVRRKAYLSAVALGFLALVAMGAVVVGAKSLEDREMPSVSVSISNDDGMTTIMVEASGYSLRSTEDMLVQVVGLPAFSGPGEMQSSCERSRFRGEYLEEVEGSVLTWQRTGPNSAGEATSSVSLEVPSMAYGAACAYVALLDRSANSSKDNRAVVAYVRLESGDE